MKWVSALSVQDDLEKATNEVVEAVREQLDATPDLMVVFPSQHFAPEYSRLQELIAPHRGDGTLIGCSAGAVIGGGREVEQQPAVAITAALLPGVRAHAFHIEQDELPDPDASPRAWHDIVGVEASDNPDFVLLVDPFSVQADQLLEGLDYAYPQAKKIGGLASGASRPGANALYLNDRVWGVGAVGVALSGNITVDTVVAQGCRPIGKPLRVTASRDNLVLELDSRRPVHLLKEIFESLDARDQELARTSLHLGVLNDELRDDIGPGDFLIRNIIGIDAQQGVMAVGDRLRDGQTVQFHLRDARSSAEDLDNLLTNYSDTSEHQQAAGALLFSCLGRGVNLYGRPDHDTELFRKHVGTVPVGGFFCNGEIGPVGTSTYVHGFTSSFGIFKPR